MTRQARLPVTLVKLCGQLLVQIEGLGLVKLELSLPVSGGLALCPVTLSVEQPPSPPSHSGAQQGEKQPGEIQAGLHL